MTARERVAEFLRQWAKMRDKGEHIYGVATDPHGDPAVLRASDLRNVLAELAALTEQRDEARGLAAKYEAELAQQRPVIAAVTDLAVSADGYNGATRNLDENGLRRAQYWRRMVGESHRLRDAIDALTEGDHHD
jgi:hypothetical protein